MRQLRRRHFQRLQRQIGARRDDAAAVIAPRIDDVEIGRGAEIDDDQRRLVAVCAATVLTSRSAPTSRAGMSTSTPMPEPGNCRADHQRLAVKIAPAQLEQVEIASGTTLATIAASMSAGLKPASSQQMGQPDDIFVGGAPRIGRGAPRGAQRVALPDREDGVGVAGVDRRAASHSAPYGWCDSERPRRRRSGGGRRRRRAAARRRRRGRESGPSERGALEPHADRRAKPACPREPGRAHRREPRLAPPRRPDLEMLDERLQQHCRGDAGIALGDERGRRKSVFSGCERS